MQLTSFIKKVMGSLALSVLVLLAVPAHASVPVGYVQMSSTTLIDATGTVIANATLHVAPVNNSGTPISFQVNGHGQASDKTVTALITNGAFTIQLADTALTSPANVCYQITATDNVSGKQLLGAAYNCVQPAGSGAAVTGSQAWCTPATLSAGATCNFDAYTPNEAALVVVQPGPVGPQGAQGIQGPGGTLSNNSGVTTPVVEVEANTGLGTGFLTTMPFSSAVNSAAGLAQDPNENCYIVSSVLQAFNCATGLAGVENTNPYSGLPAGYNHIGGIEVCGPSLNYLCAPVDIETGGVLSSPIIAEYNLSNLTLATYFSIASGSCDGSAVAYNVNTNNLVCASFYTGGGATAELWNFTSQTKVGTLTFSPALPYIQGFSYDNVHNVYCAFSDDAGMDTGYLNTVSLTGAVSPYPYNGGVIPQSGELEGGTCAQGTLIYPAPTNGGILAVVPGPGTVTMTSDGVAIQANMQTNGTTGGYSNPTGGVGYPSAQLVVGTDGTFLEAFPPQSGTFGAYNGYQFGISPSGAVTMPGGFGIGAGSTSYLYNCHYGVAYDGTYFYCSSPNGSIATYNSTSPWAQVNVNASAWSQMGLTTETVRDLEVSGGNLYVPGWSTGSSCSVSPVYAGATLGVFTASTLAFQSSYTLGGGIKAPTGVAINAAGNVAYVVDLCDSTEMYEYSLPSWTFVATVPYSGSISGMRGISYSTTTGNLTAVNASNIITLTTAGKILTNNYSPVKTGSPEGVDANYGTNGIFTQNSFLYPLTLSSCCGLQVYGVPVSSPISGGDIPVSAGNGQFIDSGYGITQTTANTWPQVQTFINNVYLDPTTSSGSTNQGSNGVNWRVWAGACSNPTKLNTYFSTSMGSGAGGTYYAGFTAPASAAMSSAGCTGARYFSLTNFDYLNFQGILELYSSLYLYSGSYRMQITAPPIALTNTTTMYPANSVTGYIGIGLSTPLGTPTYTAGTNITSAACASGYTCVNSSGEVKIVAGSSATTGTIATLNFSNPLTAATVGASGGTGYVTGDTVTFTCGTTNAVATVTATSGVVTALAVTTPGAGCSSASNVNSVSTSGVGTGLQANLTAGLSAAPNCHVDQNGGTTFYGLGHGTPTSTGFTITAGVSVASATIYVDYSCGVN
jgi:hypothetical protein